jgi:hypothetical protein
MRIGRRPPHLEIAIAQGSAHHDSGVRRVTAPIWRAVLVPIVLIGVVVLNVWLFSWLYGLVTLALEFTIAVFIGIAVSVCRSMRAEP